LNIPQLGICVKLMWFIETSNTSSPLKTMTMGRTSKNGKLKITESNVVVYATMPQNPACVSKFTPSKTAKRESMT